MPEYGISFCWKAESHASFPEAPITATDEQAAVLVQKLEGVVEALADCCDKRHWPTPPKEDKEYFLDAMIFLGAWTGKDDQNYLNADLLEACKFMLQEENEQKLLNEKQFKKTKTPRSVVEWYSIPDSRKDRFKAILRKGFEFMANGTIKAISLPHLHLTSLPDSFADSCCPVGTLLTVQFV